MKRLSLLNSHFISQEIAPIENLLDKYRKMSDIDSKFLSKLYYGDYEHEMRKFEQILITNPIF